MTHVFFRVLRTRVTSSGATAISKTCYGTSFLYNRAGKEYLVTAQHLIKNPDSYVLEVLRSPTSDDTNEWSQLITKKVGMSSKDADVIVLSVGSEDSESTMEKGSSLEELHYIPTLGQQLFFLGFPGNYNPMNAGNVRVPFTRKAMFSGVQKDTGQLLLDAHNNKGFSGSPVVAILEPKIFRIVGVVTGFLTSIDEYNMGITTATQIRIVDNIIDKNPIGAKIRER